jgi:hypothetical protein
MIDVGDDGEIAGTSASCRSPLTDIAHRIRSGGNCAMSTLRFLTPWSALEAYRRAWIGRAGSTVRDCERVKVEGRAAAFETGRTITTDLTKLLANIRDRHVVQSRLPVAREFDRNISPSGGLVRLDSSYAAHVVWLPSSIHNDQHFSPSRRCTRRSSSCPCGATFRLFNGVILWNSERSTSNLVS